MTQLTCMSTIILLCVFGLGWCCKDSPPSRLYFFFIILVSLGVFALPFSLEQIALYVKSNGSGSREIHYDNLIAASMLFAAIGVPMQLGVYCRQLFQQLKDTRHNQNVPGETDQ